MFFVIGWLTLFAVLSVFVSNPFQSEASASATPDYARVMFLHGLLIGLFLFPAIVVVMLVVEQLITTRKRRPGAIGWTTLVGTTLVFAGSLIYVFVSPVAYGSGYIIVTVGLGVVGIAILTTLWWGVMGTIERAKHVSAPALGPMEPEEQVKEQELVNV